MAFGFYRVKLLKRVNAPQSYLNKIIEEQAVLQIDLLNSLIIDRSFLIIVGNRFVNFIDSNMGYINLEFAKNSKFDDKAQTAQISNLLETLVNTSTVIMNKVKVSVKDKETQMPIVGLESMKLYLFYDYEDYRAVLNRIGQPTLDNDGIGCLLNTVTLPLIKISGKTIQILNGTDLIYLNYQDNSDKLYFLDDKNSTQLSLSGDGKQTAEDIKNEFYRLNKDSTVLQKFSFNFRRTYIPLYTINFGSSSIFPQIMWKKTLGFNSGISRADVVGGDNEEYRWYCPYFEDFKKALDKHVETKSYSNDFNNYSEKDLAEFLGLKYELYLQEGLNELKQTINIVGNNYEFIDYHLCNTPYQKEKFPFNVYYYRKAYPGPPSFNPDIKKFKIYKYEADNKNRPFADDVTTLLEETIAGGQDDGKDDQDIKVDDQKNYFLIDTPFSLGQGFEKWKNGAVIKNKGEYLQDNPNVRKDAGKEMLKIMSFLKSEVSLKLEQTTSLSANNFAGAIISNDKALKDWQTLKNTNLTKLPTDQEWCHLQGHGDNGDERVGNFVSGSKHCNTEQLAIESAHRPITHKTSESYTLKSTAYLIEDDSMNFSVDGKSYLEATDKDYRKKAYEKNLEDKKADNKANIEEELKKTAVNAPVAAFIRYKIIKKEQVTNPSNTDQKEVWKKVFDYTFEGQSEFFDQNQYNIVNRIVQYFLAPEEFFQELVNYYLDKPE